MLKHYEHAYVLTGLMAGFILLCESAMMGIMKGSAFFIKGTTALPSSTPAPTFPNTVTSPPSPTIVPSVVPSPITPKPQLPLNNREVLANQDIGNAMGGQYILTQDQFYFVTQSGNFSVIDHANTVHTPQQPRRIGTGYPRLVDLHITGDRKTAHISEYSGNNMNNADSDQATPIANIKAPGQIVMDEARGILYTIEYTKSGRLVSIDLRHHYRLTPLADGLPFPTRLQMSSDFKTAYITERLDNDQGQLVSIDLGGKHAHSSLPLQTSSPGGYVTMG